LLAALSDIWTARSPAGATSGRLLGKFLDPVADKLLLSSSFLILALLGRTPMWVFIVVLFRDLLILIGWNVLFILTRVPRIEPRALGKATTFAQMATVIAMLTFPGPALAQVPDDPHDRRDRPVHHRLRLGGIPAAGGARLTKDPRLTIVVVGRPNVGKSTLFNRLTEKNGAPSPRPSPGTTRDWIEGICHWNGRAYRVIDTGGYAPGSEDVLSSVRAQVEAWLEKADAVLWVVDAGEGLTSQDQAFARLLRPRSARVVLAVNKADDAGRDGAFADFTRPRVFAFGDDFGHPRTAGQRVARGD
jgi:small GTP-binding protein